MGLLVNPTNWWKDQLTCQCWQFVFAKLLLINASCTLIRFIHGANLSACFNLIGHEFSKRCQCFQSQCCGKLPISRSEGEDNSCMYLNHLLNISLSPCVLCEQCLRGWINDPAVAQYDVSPHLIHCPFRGGIDNVVSRKSANNATSTNLRWVEEQCWAAERVDQSARTDSSLDCRLGHATLRLPSQGLLSMTHTHTHTLNRLHHWSSDDLVNQHRHNKRPQQSVRKLRKRANACVLRHHLNHP